MNRKSGNQKSGQIVVPGERLGVIEEFVPNANTYVEDGVIYSKTVGRALFDLAHKRVSVYKMAHGAKVPVTGTTVLGQVSITQSEIASLRIFDVDNKEVSGVFTGILHISDAHVRYVDSMFDVCKPGDVMRAKVISEKNRTYHLSTKDKNLGVVFAFCSTCGNMLEPKRPSMFCPKCGRMERRKTTIDYGKGMIQRRKDDVPNES